MPRLTLETLINLSSLDAVTWLSGAAKLGGRVKWICPQPGEFDRGDLILMRSEQFNQGFLAEAKKKRAAGVLVFGGGMLDLKKSEGFPVGQVMGEYNLRALQQEMAAILLNQEVSEMKQRERVRTRLSLLASEGDDLQDIVQKMHEISGSGIVVQDKYLAVLADYPPPSLREIWSGILEMLASPSNLPEHLRDRSKAGQHRSQHSQSLPGEVGRTVTPINVRGVLRGYFSVVKIEDEFDDLDQLVAEQGPFICAAEMSRTKAVRETEKKLHGDLLTALLSQDLDPREASLWVEEIGVDLLKSHTALQFAWDAERPPSRRRLETLINGEITRSQSKIVINPMGSEVVCFIEGKFGEIRPAEAIEFAQRILENAYAEFPSANLRCGIGSPANSLNEWRISFRNAAQALEMAQKLKEARPLYYPDLSVYRLLILLEDQPDLIKFYQETLGGLLEHKDHQELIQTLAAYFDHNQNISQTAKALFMHRNTILHRMRRINEIANLDLDNPDTRLALQLALKIHTMLENGK